MRIDILTVVPELLDSPLSHSIVGRAIKNGLVDIKVHNLRKYGVGSRKNVDDYSYGGDAGMVMMVEPVFNMINELKSERDYDEVIYMSPDGERLNQKISNELSLKGNIIILCGHYKGIDHRIREHLNTRDFRRRLRGERRRNPCSPAGRFNSKTDTRSAYRRDIRPFGFFPGRPPVPSGLHQTGRIQWLEGSGRASKRESEAYSGLAGRTGFRTHETPQTRTY